MNIKKTILAPAVLTLGSLSVAAGVAAPIIASTSTSVAVASASTSGAIGRMG